MHIADIFLSLTVLALPTASALAQESAVSIIFKKVHQFNVADGENPRAELIEGKDGNFYGVTSFGGSFNICPAGGCGTVFKMSKKGAVTTLHSFNYSDGYQPDTSLVQAADGSLIGAAYFGGDFSCNQGCGTLFKISPTGTFTVLHRFSISDGAGPNSCQVPDDS